MASVVNQVRPHEIYIPYPHDAHSDHSVVFDCASAFIKPFRYPFIQAAMCYETLSETEFNFTPGSYDFKPNYFIDISEFIDKKIELALVYKSEFKKHPFPRSDGNIRALAHLRGATCASQSAEAFMILFQKG